MGSAVPEDDRVLTEEAPFEPVGRLTYREFVALAAEVFGGKSSYTILGKWTLTAARLFSKRARELRELLPRSALRSSAYVRYRTVGA